MIDIEDILFTEIAAVLRSTYSGIFVAGEYVTKPSTFPMVSIVEMDNTPDARTQTNTNLENHAVVMYQVDVYSNRHDCKKAECKAIIALIDEQFAKRGFTRIYKNPTPNISDATIYRMTTRYRAVVSDDLVVYRR